MLLFRIPHSEFRIEVKAGTGIDTHSTEVPMSDSMKVLERVIQHAGIRQNVLASNIANVDTPNYKAKDVSFNEVLGSEIRLAATNPGHIQPSGGASGADMQVEDSPSWADQNNVEMDLEVAKMTENAMLFQAAVTLLTKKISMFKSALSTSR